ncbi:hypothetical protein [Ferruginivarius sediminum]|uniref:Type II secretion system protein GspC N-terminal domain-containing protein n=1 Tax=Ferruginivarius sediminum TaxID=2661937 RepID=A0A369TG24_9PROT|nr:hypothetical protein [Ferruginivarius sediminum]RDD63067.1 hypothetical protein DRB17_04655 [Ferruginivarius sediminum]
MRRRRWPAAVPVLLLAGLCAGLGWQVRKQLEGTHVPAVAQAKVEVAANETPMEPEPAPSVDLPRISAFEPVVARNLFSTKRQPPPLQDENDDDAPRRVAPLKLTLSGVVLSDSQRVAILNDPTRQETLRMALGEKHDGWQLIQVQARSATFVRGSDERTIDMSFATAGEEQGPRKLGQDLRSEPQRRQQTQRTSQPSQPASGTRNFDVSVQPSRVDANGNPVRASRQISVDERRSGFND